MSIINEALKKAWEENKKRKDTQYKEKVERQTKIEEQSIRSLKKSKTNKKLILFVITFVIIGGVIFLKKFIPFLDLQNRKDSFISNQTAPLSSSLPRESSPRLTLNGIVYDEERPYAIVNNKVLLKGDIIEGAVLIEINKDKVKFLYKDKEFELNVD